MKEIRWGIVGPGSIAKEFLQDLTYVKGDKHIVTSIVGHSKGTAEKFQKEHQIASVFYKIEELIKSNTIDCAYVATPHPLHYQQTLQLLEAKIPVLCEKPLAINESQVSDLVNKSRETKTFLMEGMWSRCLPSLKKVVELISSEIIGEVHNIEASMSYKAPYDPESRYFNPDLGGGSLLDLGVYPAYLSYLILGKPETIKATAKKVPTGVDGAMAALLCYPNGAFAHIESSLIKKAPLEATIFGEKGSVKITGPNWTEKPDAIVLEMYDGSSTIGHTLKWEGRGFQYEVEEMMACLQASKIESDLLPHETSLNLIRIIDEIRKQTGIKYPKYENG